MLRPPAVVYSPGRPAGGGASTWCGARMVKRIPSAARTSSVSSSTAVSGSHIPEGSRPKRRRKSAIPQRTSVCLSRRGGRGRGARGGVARGREPPRQRGPHVEAALLQRVDDAGDPAACAGDPRRDDGAIALALDPLVPVVERRGARFPLHQLEPRLLPRRLVEMGVDDDG